MRKGGGGGGGGMENSTEQARKPHRRADFQSDIFTHALGGGGGGGGRLRSANFAPTEARGLLPRQQIANTLLQ